MGNWVNLVTFKRIHLQLARADRHLTVPSFFTAPLPLHAFLANFPALSLLEFSNVVVPNAKCLRGFYFSPLAGMCICKWVCVRVCVCVYGMCVYVRVCFWPQYDCCWWSRLLTKCPSGMQHCCFHAAFKCGGISISFLLFFFLSPSLSLSLSLSLSSATCLSFLLFAFVVCRFLLSVFVFWVFKAWLACVAGIVLVLVVSLGIISTDCVSFHFWLLFQLLLLLLQLLLLLLLFLLLLQQ